MSTLSVNTITAETGNTVSLASGKTLNASQGFTPPAGHVTQALESNTATSFTTTSTTAAATSCTINITPTSTNSKMFVTCQWNANLSGAASDGLQTSIHRRVGSGSFTQIGDEQISYNGTSGQGSTHHCEYTQILDSPGTTSVVTYTLYAKSHSGTSVRIAGDWGHIRICVMEISG